MIIESITYEFREGRSQLAIDTLTPIIHNNILSWPQRHCDGLSKKKKNAFS